MKKEDLVAKIDELSQLVDEARDYNNELKFIFVKISDIMGDLPSDVKEIGDDEDEEKPED